MPPRAKVLIVVLVVVFVIALFGVLYLIDARNSTDSCAPGTTDLGCQNR